MSTLRAVPMSFFSFDLQHLSFTSVVVHGGLQPQAGRQILPLQTL